MDHGVPENPFDNLPIHFLLQPSGMHQNSPSATWSVMRINKTVHYKPKKPRKMSGLPIRTVPDNPEKHPDSF